MSLSRSQLSWHSSGMEISHKFDSFGSAPHVRKGTIESIFRNFGSEWARSRNSGDRSVPVIPPLKKRSFSLLRLLWFYRKKQMFPTYICVKRVSFATARKIVGSSESKQNFKFCNECESKSIKFSSSSTPSKLIWTRCNVFKFRKEAICRKRKDLLLPRNRSWFAEGAEEKSVE